MDIGRIPEIIAQDDEIATIPSILDKKGNPYLGPDGQPCTIGVYGSESKAAKRAKRVEFKKMQQLHGKMDSDDYELSRVEKAAAHVAEWTGWESDRQLAACTPANVKALLEAEHILAQVEAGIAKHALFLAR